jgi:hypothetical protein
MTEPDDRLPILTQAQNLKMARSAHAYVRGSTAKFYEWLESSSRSKLPEGAPVWICGDCHVGNLGPLAEIVIAKTLEKQLMSASGHSRSGRGSNKSDYGRYAPKAEVS